MEVIGHRGCGDQYPENTVRAVRRASRHLPAVEVDVRRCASGEIVAFHDETVDRVTSGTGAVAEQRLAELRELDVLESGERIPTLRAVLDAVPADVRLQIELKEPGLAASVRDIVTVAGGDVCVTSFLPEALAEVAETGWDVPTGYLFGDRPRERLATAIDLGCDAVHPHYDLCVGTDVVAEAHAVGLRVVAWKAVRTAAEVDDLRAAGVDGVTADRWDVVPESGVSAELTSTRADDASTGPDGIAADD